MLESITTTKPSTATIAWVFATQAEAKPFVEALKLKKTAAQAFSLYASESRAIHNSELSAELNGESAAQGPKHLILVSGMGALNASLATAWLAGLASDISIWINLGIAGHLDKPIGELCLIHSVTGPLLERTFYPSIVVNNKWARLGLESQHQPSELYTDSAFDMEASGFVCAAQRFVSKEYVQIIKVISDNAAQPAAQFNKSHCYDLLKPHVEAVIAFADRISALQQSQREPTVYKQELTFRASHSQQRIIGDLIYKLNLAELWNQNMSTTLDAQKDARAAIAWLTSLVDAIAPVFNKSQS